jgi:hypothetical protein
MEPDDRAAAGTYLQPEPHPAQTDPAVADNRLSTITEVRTVLWPAYETPEYDAAHFLQGIAGTLELFHRCLPSSKAPPTSRH